MTSCSKTANQWRGICQRIGAHTLLSTESLQIRNLSLWLCRSGLTSTGWQQLLRKWPSVKKMPSEQHIEMAWNSDWKEGKRCVTYFWRLAVRYLPCTRCLLVAHCKAWHHLKSASPMIFKDTYCAWSNHKENLVHQTYASPINIIAIEVKFCQFITPIPFIVFSSGHCSLDMMSSGLESIAFQTSHIAYL